MKKRVVVVTLLILGAVGCVVAPRMVESTIPTVYYVTPKLSTHENLITCSGTVQSETVRQIYLQSSLVARDVLVSVGDEVTEGQTLVEVDLDKTRNMAGLPLSLIKDITDELSLSSAQSIDWASMATSYGLSAAVSGGGSGMDAAALQELVSQYGLGTGPEGVGTMVDSQTISEITAPMSGVITAMDVQKEVPTAAGKPILTIADNSRYKVLVSIREEDIARVQVGDQAKIRGVGFGGASYTGSITKIYPTARKTLSATSSETVIDAEITLDSSDKRLKPGLSAKVEIIGGNDYNLITVPYEAIKQDESNNEYVYLYQDGKLKKQVVTTGQELTAEVEILDGVSYDSVVVYNPTDAVREGAMIHIKGRADAD